MVLWLKFLVVIYIRLICWIKVLVNKLKLYHQITLTKVTYLYNGAIIVKQVSNLQRLEEICFPIINSDFLSNSQLNKLFTKSLFIFAYSLFCGEFREEEIFWVHIGTTVNFLNLDTQNICCNHSKMWTMWLYYSVMSPNDADGMANSLGAVWSGSALFAQAYLSENLGSLRYIIKWWGKKETHKNIMWNWLPLAKHENYRNVPKFSDR